MKSLLKLMPLCITFFCIINTSIAAQKQPPQPKKPTSKKVINAFIASNSVHKEVVKQIALEISANSKEDIQVRKETSVKFPYIFIIAPKKLNEANPEYIAFHLAVNIEKGQFGYVRYAKIPKNSTVNCRGIAIKKWSKTIMNSNYAQDPDAIKDINNYPELSCKPTRRFTLTSSLVIAHKGEKKYADFQKFTKKLKLRLREESGTYGAKVETPSKRKVLNDTGCKSLSWNCEFKYAVQEQARRLAMQIGEENGIYEVRMIKWRQKNPKKNTRDELILKINHLYFNKPSCQRELISTVHHWTIAKDSFEPKRPKSCIAEKIEYKSNAMRNVGLTAIGVGAASIIAGGAFWIVNANITNEFNERYKEVNSIEQGRRLHQLYRDANTTKIATIATFSVGGAILVTGIILTILSNNQNKAEKLPPPPKIQLGNSTTLLKIE